MAEIIQFPQQSKVVERSARVPEVEHLIVQLMKLGGNCSEGLLDLYDASGDEYGEVIDLVFIHLCGVSLQTLTEKTDELGRLLG